MAAVSVLIVNYQGGSVLADCLRHLQRQVMADFEAIVVDNGSTDGSLALAREAVAGDPRFVFISAEENVGFAAGNNLAARHATTPLLALLNPDAFAEPDWLARLLEAARRDPDVGMFGSTQLNAGDPTRLDGAGDHYFCLGLPWRGGFGWPASALPAEGEVFAPCAAAVLYRRAAFDAVGGFDETFFCYVEDIDLAFRLRLRGHRCIQVRDAVVRHVGGASSGGANGMARYYGTRNMVWCFVKNMPGPLFWPLFPLHLAAVFLFALWHMLRGERHAWRGLADALRQLPWKARRREQAARSVSVRSVAAAMVWNPARYLTRAPLRLRGRQL